MSRRLLAGGSPEDMLSFLIGSCGFTPPAAAKVSSSRALAAVKSLANPASVLAFLRGLGLADGEVRQVIARHPRCLVADVGRTLSPKVDALSSFGFSPADIADILAACPKVLLYKNVIPNLTFLLNYLPDKSYIFWALRRNATLLTPALPTSVAENLAVLRERGLSPFNTARALVVCKWVLTRRADQFREIADRVGRLGFAPSSGNYVYALNAVCWRGEERFQALIAMMGSFGMDEEDFHAAFRRWPHFVEYSDSTLRAKMEFLVRLARVDPASVAGNPVLLSFSVERRLAPRLRLYRALEERGMMKEGYSLATFLCLSEKKFVERFVVPNAGRLADDVVHPPGSGAVAGE